ncbi:MAG: LAGLIDADG family homing endonuclease [Candidatus Micrarchaeota archaeon]
MTQDIDTTAYISSFHDFFTSVYFPKIQELLLVYPKKKSLMVDYLELEKFDYGLADRLKIEPDLLIASAQEAIKDMRLVLPDGIDEFNPNVRFMNMPDDDMLIQNLSSVNINGMVAFKSVVTKRAEVMNRVKIAAFLCDVCDTKIKIIVTKNMQPPKRCESCKKFSLRQVDDESKFTDIQRAETQELLERVTGGAPGARIELWMEDDLVNSISPGENVEVVGILRIRPPIKSKQKQEMVYARYIEVNHVKSMKREFEEIDISKEEERRILELSRDTNIDHLIIESVAPAIYGHKEVKHAMSLQLFGGTRGKKMQGGLPIRDDIHVLLIGDPGLAKCVTGDTKIVLADGSIQKIEEMVEQVLQKDKREDSEGYYGVSNHDLPSLGLYGKVQSSKANIFWKLKSPEFLYSLKTYTGKKITVSPSHPFFTSEESLIKAKSAEQLLIGDFIASAKTLPIKGSLQKLPAVVHGKTNAKYIKLPDFIDEKFARFVGYCTGDSYLRKTDSTYEISFTNADQELLVDFENIVSSFGLQYLKVKRHGSFAINVHSVDLGRILENMGMIKTSFHKSVPNEILRSPNEIVKEFLKAYYDCEAHVSKEGITVVSASFNLLEQVQILLLRFGIISQLHETYSRATNAKNHKKTKYWRLISCGINAKIFMDQIGFTASIKNKKASLLPKTCNTNIDIVPNLKAVLKETRKLLGVTQFDMGIPRSTYQHFERGDRNPSYSTLTKVVRALLDHASKKDSQNDIAIRNISLLQKMSEANIFWDKIIKIEKIKSDLKWVYDLQVEETHNFVANGLFVHNSRILQSVNEIAPKGIYVSGKSVSGAGLTVSAEKDDLGEGGWTLKAGALVLASGGTAQIDEFDKIDDEDRASLHEAMEAGMISVAKAGMVARFKAKTAILAAANPKYGRFDQSKNLAEQFNIPPSLMSRFDLIFPIVDVLDEEKDSKLAQHILDTHMGKEVNKEERLLDRDLLRKYIAYARRNVLPKMTSAASDKIKEFYVDLRKRSKDSGSVAITPRYLEGLVRLAEANSKMRLSHVVEAKDAEISISLMNYVMRQVMTDKVTGAFDVDVIATGRSKTDRDKMQKVDTVIEVIKLILKKEDSAEIEKVITECVNAGIEEPDARKVLNELLKKGEIYEKEHGHIKLVGG